MPYIIAVIGIYLAILFLWSFGGIMKKCTICRGSGLNKLTDRIIHYQKTGKGYRSILTDASVIVYCYPKEKYGWTNDECSDFYLFFYRRLKKMFIKYRDMGKNFESYLYRVIELQVRLFVRESLKVKRRWAFAYQRELWLSDETVQEECGTDFGKIFKLDEQGKIEKSIKRRGYLLYILKHSLLISEEDIDRASRLTGLRKDRLELLMEKARRTLQNKQDKLNLLRVRRNKAYYKLKLMEQDLKNCADFGTIQYLKVRIKKLKNTLMNAQRDISRVKLSPSNRELAGILGIPKGTADTSLYSFKASFNNLYEIPNKRRA